MVPLCSDLAQALREGSSRFRTAGWIWPVALVFVIALPLAAAEEPPPALLDAWLAKQPDVRTWTAEIAQTRTLKTLTQPLTTRGHVWFQAPDQFRWELGIPAQTIAVRQRDQLLVIYPQLKRAERFSLSANRAGQWGGALALLEAGFPRDRADLDAKFRIVSQTETNGHVTVSLEPKASAARKMIPRIDLFLSTGDLLLHGTELQFPDGSRLRNEFKNVQVNPAVDPAVFEPEVPAGFKVVEPLKK